MQDGPLFFFGRSAMRKWFSLGLLALLAAGCSSSDSGRTTVSTARAQASAAPGIAAAPPPLSLRGRASRLPPPRAAGQGFARLPDRGDLVGYPKQAQVLHDGAYTWHRADLSEAHAIAAIVGGTLSLTAPSGEKLQFRYSRHVEHASGDWTWVGRLEHGAAADQAIVTFGDRAAFGRIAQPGKAPLRLTLRDGQAWLVETDPTKIAQIDNSATRPTKPDYLLPPKAAAGVSAPADAGVSAPSAAAAVSGTTVDLVLGYTNGFAAALGGVSQVLTRLNYLVEVANTGYGNSEVGARVRLVQAVQVAYPDNTDNGDTLEALTGTRTVPVDPAFNALRAARDQYGADLVSLVRKFNEPENSGCGIAWLIGGGQRGITTANAGSGYSVVSDGRDAGSGGTTYFCSDDTLAHEMGHNMGAQHDRGTASSSGTLQYGAFAYSFGHKQSSPVSFHTIMAYGDSGQPGYLTFSNPRTTFCGGQPCGVTDWADNARALAQTMPIIATFRAARRVAVRNDFDGDGKSDIYWRNVVSGFNDLWQMDGVGRKAVTTVYREPDTTWNVIGAGDFNGDGFVDVLWRNAVGGQVYIHLMNGASIVGGGYSTTVADLNWQVVALGDFDGDGRTDILWRNRVNGYNDIWLMDGIGRKAVVTVYREVDLNWTVVGAGDFNGDGMADVFWRNRATGDNYVQLMYGTTVLAGSGRTTSVPDLPFQVVAIGDFDGDGRSDLYWRNKVTGECYIWTMNATVATGITRVHVEPDQAWQVASSGDYNGDGRADIFWRNSSTGQNYIHLMSGTSILPGSSAVYTVTDQTWQITGSGT